MKWLIVLIATNLYPDGSAEHFILTNPNFSTLNECQTAAKLNYKEVNRLAFKHLGGPAKVYCFESKNLQKYLDKNAVSKPEKKEAI